MAACLMLHGVGPVPDHISEVEKPYWVSSETLGFILGLARQFAVELTFDDGNATDVTLVLPALVQAELKAAFFIPTDRIGEPGYVTAEDIAALHRAGMEIGSHGCSHLDWTTVSDGQIAHDVTRSIEILSQLIGAPVRSVAVPYGSCDRRVLTVLRRLGVGRVHTSFRGPDCGTCWIARRDCIKADMSPDIIAAIVGRDPGLLGTTLNFLRVWRHAGRAALRAAN